MWFHSDANPNCRSDIAVGAPLLGISRGDNSARKQAEEACKQQSGGTGQCGVRNWGFKNADGSENTVAVILRAKVPAFMGKCVRLTYGAGIGPTREVAEAAALNELGNRNWDFSKRRHPVEVTSVVQLATCKGPSEDFHVIIERSGTGEFQEWTTDAGTFNDRLVKGLISIDGVVLGESLEREGRMVPPGTYLGKLRSGADKEIVQGTGGRLAQGGDFLLEISGVPGRTAILFHTGTEPRHSDGCVLLGPAQWDPDKRVAQDQPLFKLRRAYYGADNPCQSVERRIFVHVLDRRGQPGERSPKSHQALLEKLKLPQLEKDFALPPPAARQSEPLKVSCGKAAGSAFAVVTFERDAKGAVRLIRVRRGELTATFTLEGLLQKAKDFEAGAQTNRLLELGELRGSPVRIPASVLGELVCGEPQTAAWNTQFVVNWGKEQLKSLSPDACAPDGGADCRPTVTSGGVRD
ncbi:MAG: DUF5675 family protein [Myxococcaceae bacterium]